MGLGATEFLSFHSFESSRFSLLVNLLLNNTTHFHDGRFFIHISIGNGQWDRARHTSPLPGGRQTWIAKAPLLVVLCVTIISVERGGRDIQIHRYPEYADTITQMDGRLYSALNQEEHQTKIAGAHMALVALEHGVTSCWVSRFEVRRVAELLCLPEGIMPAEILVFGYPEETRGPTPKKTLDEVVFYDAFGQGRE